MLTLAIGLGPRLAAADDPASAAATSETTPSSAQPGQVLPGPPAIGEPAPMSAAARALYEEGLQLYAARDFPAAIRRFEDGYVLEARREFLFAQAQAFRLAGDCAHAAPLYQRFLQTEPSSIQIDATRMGLDRCEKQEAAARAADARASAESRRARPEPPLSAAPPPTTTTDRSRWWRDPVGLAVTGAGVVALGVGVGFVIASNDALDRARSLPPTSTKTDYDRLYDLAERRHTIGLVAVIGGAAAVAGGLARLALVRYRTRVAESVAPALLTFVPSATGATLLWQGSY